MATALVIGVYTLAAFLLYKAIQICKPEWLERMRNKAGELLDAAWPEEGE